MLIEQLISFETAKLAKEKGLNENGIVWLFYEENGRMFNNLEDTGEQDYICCTQAFLQKWLREEYDIDVWVEHFNPSERYFYQCPQLNDIFGKLNHWGDTYEEALEKGLQEALKTIK